jgi:hypothetical protein
MWRTRTSGLEDLEAHLLRSGQDTRLDHGAAVACGVLSITE